jgi:hypothetical protein
METMFPAGRRSLPPVPRSTPGTPAVGAPPSAPASDAGVEDAAQEFVSRLRGAAARFAAAAGAQSAVVREAVPPARHRRARCRVVLRYADRHDADLTFLGPVDRPGSGSPSRFDDTIREWFSTGQQREPGWLVADDDAPDGVAVDVTAWLAAG